MWLFMKNKIIVDCKEIRRRIVKMAHLNLIGHMHLGSPLSIVEVLYALYFFVLKAKLNAFGKPDRDRFILDGSLGKIALYASVYGQSWLNILLEKDFMFASPSNIQIIPVIEMSNDSLGHGLSFGVGTALYAKQHSFDFHTYVLCGDGELEEGSIWEAIMSAAHFELNNLTLIINRNYLQIDDSTEVIIGLEPLDEKFLSFGWEVHEVDGHNVEELCEVLIKGNERNKPKAIIAKTTKGKGVSFMENSTLWHSRIPTNKELKLALQELQ
jgi:transketolase